MKYLKHFITFMLCVTIVLTGIRADDASACPKTYYNRPYTPICGLFVPNLVEEDDGKADIDKINLVQDKSSEGIEENNLVQDKSSEGIEENNLTQDESLEDIEETNLTQDENSEDIQEERIRKVEELMKKMTWKEKAAQMIFVTAPYDAADVQKKYQFGGYILFANDFEKATPVSMQRRIKKIQDASKIPMLIAVDEEGGTVVRASKYKQFRSKPYASSQSVYAAGKWKGIIKDTKSKAKFLKNLGINTNLAPVADVAYKKSDFIYKRSFSTNANSTSKYIRKVVSTMGEKNLISTLKHFPGYGNNGDTHTQLIHDYRSKESFEKRDLKPFQAGIDAGCDMIMVSHNIVHCFDAKNPASISPKVISYLRNNMGFEGVIVTDSLTMNGVAGYTGSVGKSTVRAVLAGNDLLCTSEYKKTYKALIKAIRNGQISRKRINESVRRILLMKCKRGVI